MIGQIYPAIVGHIAMPTNNNRVSTPADIPVSSFGDDDTIIFHVVAIVNVIGQ